METAQNVERKPGFKQVCVWPGTVLGESSTQEFEQFFTDEFGVCVQYLETIETQPDESGPSGRSDIFFAVHEDDMSTEFCVRRLKIGVRWIEDAIGEWNGGNRLYPSRVLQYKTW